MTYRTIRLFDVGCLVIAVAVSAQVAQASEAPIRTGHKVVTTAEAAVQVGARTLATVPPNTELLVTAVKDQWVAVTIQQDGEHVSGWVDRKHLATRDQATDQPAAKPSAYEARGGQPFVLAELKPTLRGHQNRAFVEMKTVGTPGKPTLTFWKKDDPTFTLIAAQGGMMWGESEKAGFSSQFNAETMRMEKVLLGTVYLAIEDDQFVGNLDYDGSVYTFVGEVRLMGNLFKSSQEKPLVFKLVKDQGFVYVSGEGSVVTKDGNTVILPLNPRVAKELASKSDDLPPTAVADDFDKAHFVKYRGKTVTWRGKVDTEGDPTVDFVVVVLSEDGTDGWPCNYVAAVKMRSSLSSAPPKGREVLVQGVVEEIFSEAWWAQGNYLPGRAISRPENNDLPPVMNGSDGKVHRTVCFRIRDGRLVLTK